MQKKFQKRGKTVKIGVFYFQQEKIWSIFANKGTTLPGYKNGHFVIF